MADDPTVHRDAGHEHSGHDHDHGHSHGLGASIADPIIGLGITLVILKITKDSWVTVRAAPAGGGAQPV